MFTWDEVKRRGNLEKHGLDFADAYLVYDNPEKVTFSLTRNGERRNIDIALVKVVDRVLLLVYTLRGEDVRIISFRVASREERAHYEREKSNRLE